MLDQHFPWKRFWCSRTGNISLNDNGFMLDPGTDYAFYKNNDVIPFEKIEHIPCLILLGEPGSGKSTALESEVKNFSERIDSSTHLIFSKNLNEYGDETRLINDIFSSPEIQKWKSDDSQLIVFLDSLDECLLDIPKLSIILRNEFNKLKAHKDRLSLRISCRTGDWQESLTDAFRSIWEKTMLVPMNLHLFDVKILRLRHRLLN